MQESNDNQTDSSLQNAVKSFEEQLGFAATNEQKVTIALEVYKAQKHAKGLEAVANGLESVANAIETSSENRMRSTWENEYFVRALSNAVHNINEFGLQVRVDE